MKQKICDKIKCAVSITKTTFLLACRNISAASSRVKDGESSYLLVFEFCNVSLWHLKNLISCEWVLRYHPSHPSCSGSSLILPVTAQTDDCGLSQIQMPGPKSKQTLVKEHVLAQPLSLLSFQALMKDLYLILGHLEIKSMSVTRLYHQSLKSTES